MDDLISRQAAIDALDFEIVHITAYCDGKNVGNPLAQYNKGLEDGKKAIEALPTAQPEPQHERIFQEIVVEYPSYNTYPECKGKPYFSIKYTENGQKFIGYGTYKPEVLSQYLKEYFMPSAQPEPSIPLSWIEEHIEWLKSLDNEFANLAAADIDAMVKKWRREQHEND